MIFNGTKHNDDFTGTNKNDTFDLQQGGEDTASGGSGNDTFNLGAKFDSGDSLNGGAGDDTLRLSGTDYKLTLGANITSIETLVLSGANDFSLIATNATVKSGHTFTIDATNVHAANTVTFDGSAVKAGALHYIAGPGGNFFTGGAGDDVVDANQGIVVVDLTKGGNDIVNFGGSAEGPVLMGAALTAADRLTNVREIDLDGQYTGTHALTLGADTIVNAGSVALAAGHDYDITLAAHTVTAGELTTFGSGKLGAKDTLTLDASAVAGNVDVLTGTGDDTVTGGKGDDLFVLTGGRDTINGGAGDDTIRVAENYPYKAHLDGGTGNDTLNFTAANAIQLSNNIKSIETFFFDANNTYDVTTVDGNVAKGATLTVDATLLQDGTNFIQFDGALEKNGAFHFLGGAGDDEFFGGHGDDTVQGGLGGDGLDGSSGHDTFVYTGAADSTSAGFDALGDFNPHQDHIAFGFAVAHVDATIFGGELDSEGFDAQVAAETSGLKKHHAVIWQPDSGAYAGYDLLVVDANGHTGYQAGEDYVIQIDVTSIAKSAFVVLSG